MSTPPKIADDFAAIAEAVKKLEAEKTKAINESKLPEVVEVPTGWWSTIHEDDLWG